MGGESHDNRRRGRYNLPGLRVNRTLRGVTFLTSSELAIRALGFLSLVVVAREMGPAALGHLAVAQALLSYGTAVGDGGVTVFALREVVRRPRNTSSIAAGATLIQLLASALLLPVLILVSLALPIAPEARNLVAVLSPLLVFQALNMFYILQAHERWGAFALARTMVQVTAAAGTFVSVVAFNSLTYVAVSIWLGALVGDIVCGALIWRAQLGKKFMPDRKTISLLLVGSVPFLGMLFLTQLTANVDILVLGVLADDVVVGHYSAAYRLYAIILSVVAMGISVGFPQLVRHFSDDMARASRLALLCIKSVSCAAMTLAALMVFASDEVTGLLYGPRYADSALLLTVLSLSVPLAACNTVAGQFLLAVGRERQLLWIATVSAIVLVGLLALAVPRWGALGAAIVVVLGETFTVTMFSWALRDLMLGNLAVTLATLSYWFWFPFGLLWGVHRINPAAGMLLSLLATAVGAVLADTVKHRYLVKLVMARGRPRR